MEGSAVLPLNGTDLFYTVQGSENGIPVLLLHGWTCDMTDWAFQLTMLLLAHTLRIITMDLRGHGHSLAASNTTAFDPVTMASDAASLLRHLNVSAERKAIVMGHNLGGSIVTELTHSYAELVQGQVLVDPAYFLVPEIADKAILSFKEEDFDPAVEEFFSSNYTPDTPDYIPQWHKLRSWSGNETIMVAAFEQMRAYHGLSGVEFLRTKEVGRIPRLFVAAKESFVAVEREVGIDDEFDQVELMEVGHWIMQTGQEQFNMVLGNWLKEWEWIPTLCP